MAQVLFADKIGTLSHSAGTITLTTSRLTIGGQQYVNSSALSRLITTDVTLVANNLYMIYAVRNAGNTELRISSNVNSVGPAGFLSWKLVGAFYATAATIPVWGSFVNIDGPPETQSEIIEDGAASLVAFVGGFASFTLTSYRWARSGKNLFVIWRLDSCVGNGVGARIPLPRGSLTSNDGGSLAVGLYSGQNGSNNAFGGTMVGLNSSDVGFSGNNLGGQSVGTRTGNEIVGTAPTTFGGNFRVFINQWSATPLKDL